MVRTAIPESRGRDIRDEMDARIEALMGEAEQSVIGADEGDQELDRAFGEVEEELYGPVSIDTSAGRMLGDTFRDEELVRDRSQTAEQLRPGVMQGLGLGTRMAAGEFVAGGGRMLQNLGAEGVGSAIADFGQDTVGLDDRQHRDLQRVFEANSTFQNVIDGTVQGAPSFAMSIASGLTGAKIGASVGGPVGAAVGSAIGAASTIFPMMLSSAWETAESHGRDMSDPQNRLTATGVALGTTAIQTIGPGIVSNALARRFTEAGRIAASRQVGKAAQSGASRMRGAAGMGAGVGFAEGMAEASALVTEQIVFDPQVRAELEAGDFAAMSDIIAEKYGEETVVAFGAGAFLGGGIGAMTGAATARRPDEDTGAIPEGPDDPDTGEMLALPAPPEGPDDPDTGGMLALPAPPIITPSYRLSPDRTVRGAAADEAAAISPDGEAQQPGEMLALHAPGETAQSEQQRVESRLAGIEDAGEMYALSEQALEEGDNPLAAEAFRRFREMDRDRGRREGAIPADRPMGELGIPAREQALPTNQEADITFRLSAEPLPKRGRDTLAQRLMERAPARQQGKLAIEHMVERVGRPDRGARPVLDSFLGNLATLSTVEANRQESQGNSALAGRLEERAIELHQARSRVREGVTGAVTGDAFDVSDIVSAIITTGQQDVLLKALQGDVSALEQSMRSVGQQAENMVRKAEEETPGVSGFREDPVTQTRADEEVPTRAQQFAALDRAERSPSRYTGATPAEMTTSPSMMYVDPTTGQDIEGITAEQRAERREAIRQEQQERERRQFGEMTVAPPIESPEMADKKKPRPPKAVREAREKERATERTAEKQEQRRSFMGTLVPAERLSRPKDAREKPPPVTDPKDAVDGSGEEPEGTTLREIAPKEERREAARDEPKRERKRGTRYRDQDKFKQPIYQKAKSTLRRLRNSPRLSNSHPDLVTRIQQLAASVLEASKDYSYDTSVLVTATSQQYTRRAKKMPEWMKVTGGETYVRGGRVRFDNQTGQPARPVYFRKSDNRPVYHYEDVVQGKIRRFSQVVTDEKGNLSIEYTGAEGHSKVLEPNALRWMVEELENAGIPDPQQVAEWAIARQMDGRTPTRSGTSGRSGGKTRAPDVLDPPPAPAPVDEGTVESGGDGVDDQVSIDTEQTDMDEIINLLRNMFGENGSDGGSASDMLRRRYNDQVQEQKAVIREAENLAAVKDDIMDQVRHAAETREITNSQKSGFTRKLIHKPVSPEGVFLPGMFVAEAKPNGDVFGINKRGEPLARKQSGETVDDAVRRALPIEAERIIDQMVGRGDQARQALDDMRESMNKIKGVEVTPSTGTPSPGVPAQPGREVAPRKTEPDSPQDADSSIIEDIPVDKVPVDKFADAKAPMPATPESLKKHEGLDAGLNKTQFEGVVRAADTWARRQNVIDEDPRSAQYSGFVFMDGTGLGKTRQYAALADSIASQVTDDRRVVIAIPGRKGRSEAYMNLLNDAKAVGANNILNRGGDDFDTSKVNIITHAGLERASKSGERAAALIVDEVHQNFRGTQTWAEAFDRFDTDFWVFSSATPADAPGQEMYFLKRLLAEQGETAQQAATRVSAELRAPPQPVAKTNAQRVQQSEYFQRLSTAMQQASKKGVLVARENPSYARQRIELIDETNIDQDMWTQAKNSSDDAHEFMNEHLKIPYMVNKAVERIRQGGQVVAVFEFSNQKKISGETWNPAVQKFSTDLKKALKAEGLTGNIEVVAGRADAQADRAIANFQEGRSVAIAGTDTQIGTGRNLDDSPANNTGKRPRLMLIANAREQGDSFIQILGRVDRSKTQTRAHTVFVGLRGDDIDLNWRRSVKSRIAMQTALRAETPDQMGGMVTEPDWLKRRSEHDETRSSPADAHVVERVDEQAGVGGILDTISAYGNSSEARLARALKRQRVPENLNIQFMQDVDGWRDSFVDEDGYGLYGAFEPGTDGGTVYLNRDSHQQARTFMHEYAHALFANRVAADGNVEASIKSVMSVAHRLSGRFENAFRSPQEFVAEAFSDTDFQRELRLTRPDGSRATLWDRFVNLVRNVLGMPPNIGRSAVSDLMEAVRFDYEAPNGYVSREAYEFLPERLARRDPGESRSHRVTQAIISKWRPGWGQGTLEKVKSSILPAMTFEHIAESYGELFQTESGNSLIRMRDLSEQLDSRVRKNNDRADKEILRPLKAYAQDPKGGMRDISVRLKKNAAHTSRPEFEVFSRLLNVSGMAGVDFAKPRSDPANFKAQDVTDKQGNTKPRDRRSREYWDVYKPIFDKAISKQGRDMYTKLRDHYARDRDLTARALVGQYLDLISPRDDGESWSDTSKADMDAELDRLRVSPDEARDIARDEGELEKLKNILSPGETEGAYFPLRRFGDYVVKIKYRESYTSEAERDRLMSQHIGAQDDDGEVVYYSVSRFETVREANQFIDRAVKNGIDKQSITAPMKAYDALLPKNQSINPDLISRFEQRLRITGADDSEVQTMSRQFALAMMDLSPDTALSSSLRERDGIEGASLDPIRTAYSYSRAQGRFVAALQMRKSIQETRQAMLGHVMQQTERAGRGEEGVDPGMTQAVHEEILKRLSKSGEDLTLNGWQQGLSDLGFGYFLVGASYNVVNATQTPLIAMPIIAAKHGNFRTARALARAYNTVGRSPMKRLWESGFTLGELARGMASRAEFDRQNYDVLTDLMGRTASKGQKDMLRSLIDRGLVDMSLSMDMAAHIERPHVDANGRPVPQSKLRYLTEWMRMAPHLIEVMNRSVTAVAAYELELAQGRKKGLSEADAHTKATEYAGRAVKDSHFVYAGWNKARVMQNPNTRLLLMFKQHPQHVYYIMITRFLRTSRGLMKKAKGEKMSAEEQADFIEARRALTYFIGMHTMAAGAIGGMPEPIKALFVMVASLLSDSDEPFDYELEIKNAMNDWFGPTMGSVFSSGLPAGLGVDLSTRVGIDKLAMFGAPRTSSSDALIADIAEIAGGPLFSLGKRSMGSVDNFRKGEYLKALEGVTPKIVRDPVRSLRFQQQGFVDGSGVQYANSDAMNSWEYAVNALGFTPTSLTDIYTSRGVLAADRQMMAMRSGLYERMFIRARDGKPIGDLLKEAQEWNRRNPAYPITADSIKRSLRERQRRSQETVKNVYVPKTRRDHVTDRIRFTE